MLTQNGVGPADFAEHVFLSMRDGRREDRKVVVLVGRFGGEGTSFSLAPLRKVFGMENIFEPPKDTKEKATSFPLLDLETKQVVLLDELSFCNSGVALNTQLVWMEGKLFKIVWPQNSGAYQGHFMYECSAPLFITCKELEMDPIIKEAERAIKLQAPCEATMLLRRMRRYHFSLPLPVPANTFVQECVCCSSRMVLEQSPTARA